MAVSWCATGKEFSSALCHDIENNMPVDDIHTYENIFK